MGSVGAPRSESGEAPERCRPGLQSDLIPDGSSDCPGTCQVFLPGLPGFSAGRWRCGRVQEPGCVQVQAPRAQQASRHSCFVNNLKKNPSWDPGAPGRGPQRLVSAGPKPTRPGAGQAAEGRARRDPASCRNGPPTRPRRRRQRGACLPGRRRRSSARRGGAPARAPAARASAPPPGGPGRPRARRPAPPRPPRPAPRRLRPPPGPRRVNLFGEAAAPGRIVRPAAPSRLAASGPVARARPPLGPGAPRRRHHVLGSRAR